MKIALIGLGEVGAIIAEDLAPRANLSAWDTQFANAASKPSRAMTGRPIRRGKDAADAVSGVDLVISAVTAAQTENAASDAGKGISKGAWYLDLNSASPGAKRNAAQAINSAGGKYVEAAVMSPFPPKRSASPILLGGPYAEAFLPIARDLGFSGARVFSPEYGKASAAKLCRSVMVKGIEALLTESMLSARYYGVEDTVLASLDDLFPGPNWPKLSRYMISRAVEHGTRRAEEMREAARTVKEAGIAPLLSEATAARQDWAAAFKNALAGEDLQSLLDVMREEMDKT